MDSIPSQKIRIYFENLKLEPSFFPFKEDWQIQLGVVGKFSIHINDKELYEEVDFCLVEFAVQVCEWLNEAYRRDDFIYTSVESDEAGLVWIKKSDGMWRIGSVHQEYEELRLFKLDEIDSSLKLFVENLIDAIPHQLKDKILRIMKLS